MISLPGIRGSGAHAILHYQGLPEEADPLRENGEADHEHSSELERDDHA